jgi:hypothetical protein
MCQGLPQNKHVTNKDEVDVEMLGTIQVPKVGMLCESMGWWAKPGHEKNGGWDMGMSIWTRELVVVETYEVGLIQDINSKF